MSRRLRVWASGHPRQATITKGRPSPISPSTQATRPAPTRRGPGATTPGLGGTLPRQVSDEAVADSRPNGVVASPFLTPLGPRAPPPRRSCNPKEVSTSRGSSSRSAQGWGRGGGGAGEADRRRDSHRGRGWGGARRAGRGHERERAGRAPRGAGLLECRAWPPGDPSPGRARPARSARAFEVVDKGGRSLSQRRLSSGGSTNPPQAMSHRAPRARPRSGQRFAGAPARPAAAARL